MTHENPDFQHPDFQHNALPASQDELRTTMLLVTEALDGPLGYAAEFGEDSVVRQLTSDQMQGYPLGSRFDHVSMQYGITDDPVDPTRITPNVSVTFQRFANQEAGSVGLSETVNLTIDGSGEVKGFVMLDEGGALPPKSTSDPITERLATEQFIENTLDAIRNTDSTKEPLMPYTDPGEITRDNLQNIAEAIAIMHAVYPEVGTRDEDMFSTELSGNSYADWERDPSSNPEFSQPAEALDGQLLRRIAAFILAKKQSLSHVFSETAIAAVGSQRPPIRAAMYDRGQEGLIITETRLASPPERLGTVPHQVQLGPDGQSSPLQFTERTHIILPDGTIKGSLTEYYANGESQFFDSDAKPSLRGECNGISTMMQADLGFS